jgi:D-3-phosphoglycerate dehydrogenase
MVDLAIAARLAYDRWTDPVAGEVLGTADGIELTWLDVGGPAEAGWGTLGRAHGYQAAVRTVCSQVAGGEQWLTGRGLVERCGDLLAVATAGAGYDVVDVDACTDAGVIVCNNSGPGAEAVAEHALAMMLALAKKLVLADRMTRADVVHDRMPLRGTELLGKTLGVVGLGAIGSRLVELCAPFRMTVLAHDPYALPARAAELGVELVGLDELLDRSDGVQVTCPLTPETSGLFGRDAFARMKPTAYFVTTARGEVHDEMALLDALERGEIAGAGLDVFHTEPVDPDHPLLARDDVVASPHTAGITAEAAHGLAVATAQQWITVFSGGVPPGLVNPSVWPHYQDRFEKTFGTRPADLPGEPPAGPSRGAR